MSASFNYKSRIYFHPSLMTKEEPSGIKYSLRTRLISTSSNTSEKSVDNCSTMDFDYGLAVKLIPEFGGDHQTPLHKFINCCDGFYGMLSKESKPTFLTFIPHKLNGQAYSVYRFGTFKNWDELKIALNHNFKTLRAMECIQLDLMKATQARDESVQMFANKIETLLAELNEACLEMQGKLTDEVQQLNSKTALRSFQCGLREPIGIIIKAGDFKSLKNAIAKALVEETQLTSKIAIQPNINQLKPQVTKCQICQKNGHMASVCFSRYSGPGGSRAVPPQEQL